MALVSTDKKAPAVVVADASGDVVYMNRSAKALTGRTVGQKCWDTVGKLEESTSLPCEFGCVQRLLEGGVGHGKSTTIQLPNGRYNLACLALGGQAVCVLSSFAERREPWQRVTPRERDVLRLLAKGETTGGIAEALGMSEGTVRTHIEHMRHRFGVSTRAGLVGSCYQLGLI